MKKTIGSLLLMLALLLTLPGLAGAQASAAAAAPSGENSEGPAADGAETPAEMMSIFFIPNLQPEETNAYPYLGLTLTLPEALRDRILSDEVFMLADGEIDYGLPEDEKNISADWQPDYDGVDVPSAYVEFLYLTEAGKEGLPSSPSFQGFVSMDEYEAWKDALPPLARISVYKTEAVKDADIAALTGYPVNEWLGDRGAYSFYFSTNTGENLPSQEARDMLALCEAMADGVEITAPKPIDGMFMGFTTPEVESVSSLGDFAAADLDGQPVGSDIFADAKLTMVNIWTTWCSPCIMELPDLAEIARERAAEGVQLLGIVQDTVDEWSGARSDEAVEMAQAICERTGADYTMLVPDAVLMNGVLANVLGFPTTYFVDQNGQVVGEMYLGSHSKAEWNAIIDGLLAGMEAQP